MFPPAVGVTRRPAERGELPSVFARCKSHGGTYRMATLTDPSSLHAARHPITTVLALALLLAVLVGTGAYVYEGSAEGFAYLVGLAIAAGLVLGLIGFFARKSKRPMRWDVGLVIVALFLIWTNRERLLETYDLRRFQAELRSASPEEREAVLEASTTRMAALLRGVTSCAREAGTEISAIFAELELDESLTGESLNDIDRIYRAAKMANEKAALAGTAMQRIEAIMANELQQDQRLATAFSTAGIRVLIQGVEKRHARHHPLYKRRVDLQLGFLKELDATLAFVSSRAGTYQIERGEIYFQSTEDADRYGAHVAKLQDLTSQEDQLDKDIREEQEWTASTMLDQLFPRPGEGARAGGVTRKAGQNLP